MQGCKWFELSTNDTIKLLTWEPPLIVQQSILNRKPIKGKPIPCTSSSWARWWWSWLPQDGPPFLIVLAWWRLIDCSPILTMGEPLFSISSQVHCHHNGRQASSTIYSCWFSWTCTPQSWWRSPLDVILHGLYEIFLLMQAHGNTPNPHIELSRRPWVSTQTRNGQCLPYHGITWSLSVHLVRFVCWSSWFTLCLRSWSTLCLYDHSLDNTLNTILVII